MFTERFGKNSKDNRWIIGMYVLAVIFLLVFLFPYVYMLLSSFKPSAEVISTTPSFFPKVFSLENYRNLTEYADMGKFFGNSILAAVFSTIICLILGSMASYAISRTAVSKLSNFFLILVLCLKMIPMSSVSVPIYSLIQKLGFYDSLPALIVVYAAVNMPFVLWMMISFFKAIPISLDEAASIDGASPFTTFRKIILPITASGIVSTGIFTFLLAWNDFLLALLLTSSNAKTVPVALSEFLTAYNLDLGPMTAAATLFSLPVIAVSFFLQKYLVSGMMAGSVKE
ncbi:carbohydrate ABC transporter permease [Listeria sp. FSL L7-1517]|uniref:carbohydrate ABC transporter permease n=2 Tax=Listeria TaxID=1637 RepID=UPI00164ED6C5|nr:carbohydrate ABC transporter permease [Listeria immobilis]MBC6296079.1 carbohydrate ABC transporter permease [Listeria immobilis]MBM5609143.1 carbohydrate ABC transporter permease [Listeria ivanovii]MBM5637869.1 carbohydrate ABC transporter permease [Listeria ivanovii]MBM5707013.1 carbohydrate ABC transporter permease [Listeria ivanovii]